MEKELLTIPEFAEKKKKKKQGIYEQAKNEKSKLFPFVVLQGEKLFIKREALKEVYGIERNDSQDNSQESQANSQDNQGQSQGNSQENQVKSQVDSQESQANSQDDSQAKGQEYTEKSMIVFLQRQLEEKDRQLAEKDKQIERIQQLLDQEQKLHLSTKVLLMEYTKQEEPQEEQEAAPKDTIEQERQEEPKQEKKSFWARLFGL